MTTANFRKPYTGELHIKIIFTTTGPHGINFQKDGLQCVGLYTVDEVMNDLIETPEDEEVFVIAHSVDDPQKEPIRKTVLDNLPIFKAKVLVAALIVVEPCDGMITLSEMNKKVEAFRGSRVS